MDTAHFIGVLAFIIHWRVFTVNSAGIQFNTFLLHFLQEVARKRHIQGIPASPISLGIKKNGKGKKSKNIQKESTIKADPQNILSEPTKCKPNSKHGEDVPPNSDTIYASCNQTNVLSEESYSTHKDSENPSTIENVVHLSESASIFLQDAGTHYKTSLSLLSCDYGSSNSSSDNE